MREYGAWGLVGLLLGFFVTAALVGGLVYPKMGSIVLLWIAPGLVVLSAVGFAIAGFLSDRRVKRSRTGPGTKPRTTAATAGVPFPGSHGKTPLH